MNVKKFTVEAQPTDPRSNGSRMRMRIPPSSCATGSRRAARERARPPALREGRKPKRRTNTASARIATGAVNTCTSTPASDGPADVGDRATRREPAVGREHLLARHRRGEERAVREVEEDRARADEEDDEVKLLSDRASKAAASGIEGEEHRTRDVRDDHHRRLTRRASTQTPTGSEKRRCGNQKSAVSRPICVARRVRASTPRRAESRAR